MNATDEPPAHEGVPATPDWLAKLGNEASRIAADGDAEAAEALLTCAFNTGPGDIGPVGLGRALVQLTLQLDEVARWQALAGKVDETRHAAVLARLRTQAADAAAWRDKCLGYFGRRRGREARTHG